jgi:ABC-type transporter Mla subunit MlaD
MAGAPPIARHRSKSEEMIRRLIIVTALLATGVAAADHQADYTALKTRAASAKVGEQDKLYAQLAMRATEVANDHYTAGDVTKAQAAIDEVVSCAEKARAAALQTNKNLKQTEITLRETLRRLDDLRRTLAVEDRPYVETAINRIETVRKQLLDQMFGPKPKERK